MPDGAMEGSQPIQIQSGPLRISMPIAPDLRQASICGKRIIRRDRPITVHPNNAPVVAHGILRLIPRLSVSNGQKQRAIVGLHSHHFHPAQKNSGKPLRSLRNHAQRPHPTARLALSPILLEPPIRCSTDRQIHRVAARIARLLTGHLRAQNQRPRALSAGSQWA